MDYMHETLLIILGFLFGVSGQVIVSLNMEKRKKRATQDLIRSEMQSLMESCENAGKMRFWDSTTVEHLCRHIIESYTNDRDRFMAFSSHSPRQQVFRFYLEANGMLSLIENHRKSPKIDEDGSSAAIGPGTYEGMVARIKAILNCLN
jgi:hypothetical protein